MPFCVVPGCGNYGYIPGVSYHQLPSKPKLKEKWINIINRSPLKNFSKRSVVCSVHFCLDEIRSSKGRKYLRKNTVPSLNMPKKQASSSCADLMRTPESPDRILESSPKSDSSLSVQESPINIIKIVHNYNSILPINFEVSPTSSSTKTAVSEDVENKALKVTSSSSDSIGLKKSPKTRRRLLRTYHNYGVSPMKLEQDLEMFKQKLKNKTAIIKAMKKRETRLKMKIDSLKTIVKDLENKKNISDKLNHA